MGEDQLVHHCGEGQFQSVVLYEKHVALALVVDVGIAAPRRVFVSGAAVNSALEGVAALTADDLAGKGIAVLVFLATFDDAFLVCSLTDKGAYCFKILPADDRFVMILDHVLSLLAMIVVSDEL